MPFATNNGVRIHWQEEGEGTPVLLIMGHKYSSAMWWPVLPALTAKHRVVWFDNRGTGKSDAPKTASVAEMVADTITVMDAAGLDSAHVWGVSMGGGIAQQLAVKHPERVRGLILGCTAIKTEVTTAHPILMSILARLPLGAVRVLGGKRSLGNTPPDIAAKDYAMQKKDEFSPSGVVAQHVGIAGFSMTLEDAAGITAPTFVQHGTADPLVPYDAGVRIAETVPGARLSTFEGAAHNYLLSDIGRAGREALEFFAEVDSARATTSA
ncbi:MAG TPA: alpha/beta fold hydrolase [Mycobacteriales bacterium]|nr:alpha/beta fold hydrolase [Mycobacteriales bacterium]